MSQANPNQFGNGGNGSRGGGRGRGSGGPPYRGRGMDNGRGGRGSAQAILGPSVNRNVLASTGSTALNRVASFVQQQGSPSTSASGGPNMPLVRERSPLDPIVPNLILGQNTCRNCNLPNHKIDSCDELCVLCRKRPAKECYRLNECHPADWRTIACKSIEGRGDFSKRGNQTIQDIENEVGHVITTRHLADILRDQNDFPPMFRPYRRERGDFFFDGGVPLSNGGTSSGYLEAMKDCLAQYTESLVNLDKCIVFRFLPPLDCYVYLKNKDLKMIQLLKSGVLTFDIRHEAVSKVMVDVDEDGEEEDDDYDDEELERQVSQPSISRQRGPSVHTMAYKNLTTIVVPLAIRGPHSAYHLRSMVCLNKISKSAPVIIRLVDDRFDQFNENPEVNDNFVYATYRGKVHKSFRSYDGVKYVEITCENGFRNLYAACEFDMDRVGDSFESPTAFTELIEKLQAKHPKRKFTFVFRTAEPKELTERRVQDYDRVLRLIPNRPTNILPLQMVLNVSNVSGAAESQEVILRKATSFTPWNCPDDAYQMILGGPKYVARYNSASTKRISRFENVRNNFWLQRNQEHLLYRYNMQRNQRGANAILGPFEAKKTLDSPVYFCDRTSLYGIFDEVERALPYFTPSAEQRHYCVEVLIMNGGFNLVKVFPGAGKSLLARISIYVRLVFYLRATQYGPWPSFEDKVRLPRFLYVALSNDTVTNCADSFVRMVDDLHTVYPPDVIRNLVVQKFAKPFTSESVDPRVLDISNKKVSSDGQVHLDMNTKLVVFSTIGVLSNRRSFPSWVPDVLIFEEASQVSMDEFMRCIVRDEFTGKRNRNNVPILAQHGIVLQILSIGDPMQLVTDVKASYNKSHFVSRDRLADRDWVIRQNFVHAGSIVRIQPRGEQIHSYNIDRISSVLDISAFNMGIFSCNPNNLVQLHAQYRSDEDTIRVCLDLFYRMDYRPDSDGWDNGRIPHNLTIQYFAHPPQNFVRLDQLFDCKKDHGYLLVDIPDKSDAQYLRLEADPRVKLHNPTVNVYNALVAQRSSSNQARRLVQDVAHLLDIEGVSPDQILILAPYENQRAKIFGEILTEIERYGFEELWQPLLSKTLVTERAVGEEAYYVFVSISLNEGELGFMQDVKDRLIQCIRNSRIAVLLSRARVFTVVYLDVKMRKIKARGDPTNSLDRFIKFCEDEDRVSY